MTLSYAFQLLGLSPNQSGAEITKRYHTLVREYHPDTTHATKEVAHIIMTKINEAYHLVQHYTQQKEHHAATVQHTHAPVDTPVDRLAEQSADRPLDTAPRYQESPPNREAHQLQGAIPSNPLHIHHQHKTWVARCADAIHYYYHLGLNNVPLRQEGSARLQYSRVCNTIKRIIQSAPQPAPHSATRDGVWQFKEFITLFYTNIQLNTFMQPSNKKIYREFLTYTSGCKAADDTLIAWYCYELIRKTSPFLNTPKYNVAYATLCAVAERNLHPEITAASEVTINLLEKFLYSRYIRFYS